MHHKEEWSGAGEQGRRAGHDRRVSRDRFDIFMQHCADVGLRVEWADLGAHRRGHCHAPGDLIVLNHRLTFLQAASTGIHEFAHWAFGDTESTPAVERRAWEYGASLLIEPAEYAAAEATVGPHINALGIELGVTPRLVEAWRQWWLRHRRVDVSTDDRDWTPCDGG